MTMKPEIVGILPPLHPGEVLREEFMIPLSLTAGKIAKACGVPRNRIELIAREKLGISGDTALRLGKALGTTPDLWMNLQKRYELKVARLSLGDDLDRIEALAHEAA